MPIENAKNEHNIYALIDPRNSQVRYIGRTKHSLAHRLAGHIKTAKRGKSFPVSKWIRRLLALHMLPMIQMLEAQCSSAREAFWIDWYQRTNTPLLNCTDGGDGLAGATETTRALLAARTLANWQDPSMRLRMMAARLPQVCTLETRQKLSAKNRGRKHTELTKQKMRKPKTEQHRLHAMLGRQKALAEGRGTSPGSSNGLVRNPESVLRGSKNPIAKLTEEQVIEMRALYHTSTIGTPRLARIYGIRQVTVWRIVKGISWQHVPMSPTPLPQ